MANPTQPASNVTQNQTSNTNTPAAAAPTAQPTPSEIRKLKLKLEGQDVEMPENEVIALAQQGKVAGKRFQEAAQIRKQAEDIIKYAKENPTEFFAKTGMNARDWAEKFLIEEIKREQMNPEQKKAWENEQKLKEIEDERKKEKEAKEAEDRAELEKKHHDNYERLFVEALNKSGLPKTPYTIRRMAELQLVNLRKKLDLSADQLAKVVREDYIAEQRSLFGQTEGDQLLEMLGPDVVKKLSKAQIAKLKSKNAPKSGSAPAPKTSDNKGMSWKEYQRRNRRLI